MIPKIKISNLTKSFGQKKVLQGINLEVNQGESLVILGGSGTGKSVLIKIIAGLINADQGSIKIDNQEKISMDKIGFLFQGGALFDSLTIFENIAFRFLNSNKNKKQAKTLAKNLVLKKIKAVGLEERVLDLYPAELSGGMQKRASLARTIATDPEIIFFDEPTTGLDPIMADVINNLIISNSKTLGATTITITHDMHSARKIADKIAMLQDGKIIWFGDISELDNSGNDYVDQFINGRAEI